jgi:hypothetical protein
MRLRRLVEGSPQPALHAPRDLVSGSFVLAHIVNMAAAEQPFQPPRRVAILAGATHARSEEYHDSR